ncbi:hypothetical protein BV372_28040 [Nostoc sp. T09]|uniref:hypothetical protein n=1 Tax=Nostoc sp. T09 TaxID=1932621 RepID=UPI000B67E292|nr:hypothetical protein [Nostoc sp. T09]OUL25415.1 hypothetical protein BV372_28040 [Nostoc sp. T09]
MLYTPKDYRCRAPTISTIFLIDRAHQYTRLVKLYVALGRADKAQQVIEKTQETSLRDYLQAWIYC